MDEIRRRPRARPVGDAGRLVPEVEPVPGHVIIGEHDVDTIRRAMRCVRGEQPIVGPRIFHDVTGDPVEDDVARRGRNVGIRVPVRVVVPEWWYRRGGIESDAPRVVDFGAGKVRSAVPVTNVLAVEVDDVAPRRAPAA